MTKVINWYTVTWGYSKDCIRTCLRTLLVFTELIKEGDEHEKMSSVLTLLPEIQW